MVSPKKQTRVQEFMLFAVVLLGVVALLLALVRAILAGYGVAWTGFGDSVLPSSDYVPGKTLWDWMELLFIPLFLAGGAFYLERSERAVERKISEDRAELEREIAIDRQQEAALQAYLDRMADLLLNKKLREDESEEAWNVARVRTLTVLRGLNAARNGIVLRFLRDIELVGNKESKLLVAAHLEGADLKGVNLSNTNLNSVRLEGANLERASFRNSDLEGAILRDSSLERANLRDTNLNRAVLSKVNLQSAFLYEAILQNTNLEGANLKGANLQNTNLENAHLEGANLQDAILQGASLRKANLKDAQVSGEQLATVKSLEGATMPDGTKHD